MQETANATVLTAGMLTLVIPNNCPYDDVVSMVAELMAFAENMQGAAGQQQPVEATPAPAPTKRASRTTH